MKDKVRKFIAFSRHKKMLFFEAWFSQLLTGLLLKFIRFKNIPRLYSSTSHLKPDTSSLAPSEIKTAIQSSARFSPWKNKCLVQSLAGRRMLNRRKIPSLISLGLASGKDGKMAAHAWLKAGDFEIVEKSGDYTELFSF